MPSNQKHSTTSDNKTMFLVAALPKRTLKCVTNTLQLCYCTSTTVLDNLIVLSLMLLSVLAYAKTKRSINYASVNHCKRKSVTSLFNEL